MKAHLKEAINNYPEEKRSCLIHPVSEIDAQIMIEVIELFKKVNNNDAVNILKNWKLYKDDDIAMALLELNTNTVQKVVSSDEPPSNNPADIIRYLSVYGRRIDLYLLIGYDSIEVDLPELGLRYCIRLNPTPDGVKNVPFYSNEVLVFQTEEARDGVLESLDSYMGTYRGAFLG